MFLLTEAHVVVRLLRFFLFLFLLGGFGSRGGRGGGGGRAGSGRGTHTRPDVGDQVTHVHALKRLREEAGPVRLDIDVSRLEDG